jgi:hypothetical protein
MVVVLSSWDPSTGVSEVEAVRRVEDVAAAAERLLGRYRVAGSQLPGMELQPDDDDHGRLAIAVAPGGWALIHTDKHFDQHCTQAEAPVPGESLEVMWDELTTIPRRWFVPRELAMAGVQQWLEDGTLSPRLRWSDHCY